MTNENTPGDARVVGELHRINDALSIFGPESHYHELRRNLLLILEDIASQPAVPLAYEDVLRDIVATISEQTEGAGKMLITLRCVAAGETSETVTERGNTVVSLTDVSSEFRDRAQAEYVLIEWGLARLCTESNVRLTAWGEYVLQQLNEDQSALAQKMAEAPEQDRELRLASL